MPERKAIYLRYRSRKFADLVAQEPLARTLRNAIARGSIAHAYLLTGPRGTGKTTTARLIAKAANCLDLRDGEPCDQCENCVDIREGRFLDLIEIDAASNRSIDDVRDLREKVRFAPSRGRYKVYVIDEAHQLSGDAFNALLKTLEEPPPHVIFVLATTEPHKVPATILSRTQRFDLRRIPHAAIVDTLRNICEQEGFTCEARALDAIARYAAGSLRDAESILDQVATFAAGGVTFDELRALLGLSDWEEVSELFDALAKNDSEAAIKLIERLIDDGRDPYEFVRRAIDHARALVLAAAAGKYAPETGEDLRAVLERQAKAFTLERLARIARRLTEAAEELRYGDGVPLPLELAILDVAATGSPTHDPSPPPPSSRDEDGAGGTSSPRPTASTPMPSARATPSAPATRRSEPAAPMRTEKASVVDIATRREQRPSEPAEPPAYPVAAIAAVWPQIVERFRARSLGTAAHLAQAEPLALEGHVVVIGFSNDFARAKVAGDSVRPELERHLGELVGPGLRVRCVARPPDATDDPMLRAALETFQRPDRILDVE